MIPNRAGTRLSFWSAEHRQVAEQDTHSLVGRPDLSGRPPCCNLRIGKAHRGGKPCERR
jgi:hypothetical protein